MDPVCDDIHGVYAAIFKLPKNMIQQALWQMLWVNPVTPLNSGKSTAGNSSKQKSPLEFLQHRVSVVAAELLSQVFMTRV